MTGRARKSSHSAIITRFPRAKSAGTGTGNIHRGADFRLESDFSCPFGGCGRPFSAAIIPFSEGIRIMSIAVQGQWDALSGQFAEIADRAGKFTVAVHGGGRVASSGVAWRSGIVVTVSHMLRRSEDVEVTLPDKSCAKATVLGRDPGTDVAVLRLDGTHPEPIAQFSKAENLRVGHLIMAIGRSTQGDLAANAGIVARLGGAWQSWRGGQIDSLLR